MQHSFQHFKGSDYTIIGGADQTIEFDQFDMSRDVTVTIHNDDIGEGDEVIALELVTDVTGNMINVDFDQRTMQIIIIEDDSKT